MTYLRSDNLVFGNNMKTIYPFILCAGSILFSGNLLAQEDNQKRGHKPPQEAVTACKGKSEGDIVSFETPHGDTVEGTCKLMQEQLAAVPAKGERPQRKKD